MRSSVARPASGFETLESSGYLAPGFSPRAPSSAAATAQYKQVLPTPAATIGPPPVRIATTSARPGKATNQRIVYTRVQSVVPDAGTGHLAADEVFEGDVVFCHRFTGRDSSQTARVATLHQMNRMLADPEQHRPENQNHGAPGGRPIPPFLADDLYDYAMDEFDTALGDSKKASLVNLEKALSRLNGTVGDDGLAIFEAARAYERNPLGYQWGVHDDGVGYCPLLSEWVLDGIVCGTEHQHGERATMRAYESNPGEALNVCIGGPTLMRNSPVGPAPQRVDDRPSPLDKVFVGLVARPKMHGDGAVALDAHVRYVYQYKLFTGGQLASVLWQPPSSSETPSAKELERGATTGTDDDDANDRVGLSMCDFECMIDVWRIGSILDGQSGMLPYACMTVNVVVERMTMRGMRDAYHGFFGELGPPRLSTFLRDFIDKPPPSGGAVARELLAEAKGLYDNHAFGQAFEDVSSKGVGVDDLAVSDALVELEQVVDAQKAAYAAYMRRCRAARSMGLSPSSEPDPKQLEDVDPVRGYRAMMPAATFERLMKVDKTSEEVLSYMTSPGDTRVGRRVGDTRVGRRVAIARVARLRHDAAWMKRLGDDDRELVRKIAYRNGLLCVIERALAIQMDMEDLMTRTKTTNEDWWTV